MGGVADEEYKDLRRNLRVSTEPIWTMKSFDDFQFSNANYGSRIFISFLRELAPFQEPKIIFTDSDIRPENIIVQQKRRWQLDGNGID
jgi:hypothetical protein